MLESTAQFAEVLETMEPIVFYSDRPSPELVHEMHEPEHQSLEVQEPNVDPENIEIVVDEYPGATGITPEQDAKVLEVRDDTIESNETLQAKDSKPKTAWDWEEILSSNGPQAFMGWVKERLETVPKHSGYDKAGLLRAVGYLEKLTNEVSKAMRADLDGKLDADQIEELLAKIDDGIDRLHARIDVIGGAKKKKRKSKKADFEPTELVKEAQKMPTISGIVVTVPLLISRCARVCINSVVSAGHDMHDVYDQQVEKFKLNEREQAELQQLIMDMGFAVGNFDRGYVAGKDNRKLEEGKFDMASQYQA